jgi:hypothetical protein
VIPFSDKELKRRISEFLFFSLLENREGLATTAPHRRPIQQPALFSDVGPYFDRGSSAHTAGQSDDFKNPSFI